MSPDCSIGTTWELVRNPSSQAPPTESETQGLGPSSSFLTSHLYDSAARCRRGICDPAPFVQMGKQAQRLSSSCKVTARKWPAKFQIPVGLILEPGLFSGAGGGDAENRENSQEGGEEFRSLFLRGSWLRSRILVFTSVAARHQRGKRPAHTVTPHAPTQAGREGQSRAWLPGSRLPFRRGIHGPPPHPHHKTHKWEILASSASPMLLNPAENCMPQTLDNRS